ncbi:SubName: Full=Uncharacterized protein {ECO:0000313/EMBL:CCA75843.1} [Serendipita indica DSM 11827]|nr:SubName: Full=Uncharacterized protein {ECO:0000313/EMBL:CCA75843.1} [Serendipita indica DSM 11827]
MGAPSRSERVATGSTIKRTRGQRCTAICADKAKCNSPDPCLNHPIPEFAYALSNEPIPHGSQEQYVSSWMTKSKDSVCNLFVSKQEISDSLEPSKILFLSVNSSPAPVGLSPRVEYGLPAPSSEGVDEHVNTVSNGPLKALMAPQHEVEHPLLSEEFPTSSAIRIQNDTRSHRENWVKAPTNTRPNCLRDMITKLIRPVVRMKRLIKNSIRQMQTLSSLLRDPDPRMTLPRRATNPNLTTAGHPPQTNPSASPQASIQPQNLASMSGHVNLVSSDHHRTSAPPPSDTSGAVIGVGEVNNAFYPSIRSPSTHPLVGQKSSRRSHSSSAKHTTVNSDPGCSYSVSGTERNLTGHVHLYLSHKVYDGPYSTVYPGVYNDGFRKELVAIKVVKSIGPIHSIRRRRRREVITGTILRHPNILPVYGIAEGKEFGPFGGIVTPWCPNGSAVQYLYTHDTLPAERYRLWKGVVDGLAYLHAHVPQIVHGDMKPPNILIADDGRPMICDLGLARVEEYRRPSSFNGVLSYGCWEWMVGINTTSAHTGTPRYLAPEQVDPDNPSRPTMATDVYAVGCIGYELIYSAVPYAHRKHNLQWQIFHDIHNGVPPARRPDIATPSSTNPTVASSEVCGITILWDVLELCWSRDPCRRPSASDLCEWLAQDEDVIIDALERRA